MAPQPGGRPLRTRDLSTVPSDSPLYPYAEIAIRLGHEISLGLHHFANTDSKLYHPGVVHFYGKHILRVYGHSGHITVLSGDFHSGGCEVRVNWGDGGAEDDNMPNPTAFARFLGKRSAKL